MAAHLGARPGELRELETNAVLGSHAGFWFHTLGQRQGLGLSNGPWYVAAKDATRNLVYVSRRYHSSDAPPRNSFRAGAFAWLGEARPAEGVTAGVRVKVRHGPRLYACALRWETRAEAAAAEAAAAEAACAAAARVPPPPSRTRLVSHDPIRYGDASSPVTPQPAAPPAPGLTAVIELLDGNDQGLAAGQYAVFYDAHGTCFGAGVILDSPACVSLQR